MIDFEFATEIMGKCMNVLTRYYISEEHIAELYKRTAVLHRFPFAKAIEYALLDDNIKRSNYINFHSCILEGSRPVSLDDFNKYYKREYNKVKYCFDQFTKDLTDCISISDCYKNLSQEQINKDENTHFSDSFIKQIKYRLLGAIFIDYSEHLFGYGDWAFRENTSDIIYAPFPLMFPPVRAPFIKVFDIYMNENGKDEITIGEAVDVLQDKGVFFDKNTITKKKDRIRLFKDYLENHSFGECAKKRGPHWYIIKSNAFWPTY